MKITLHRTTMLLAQMALMLFAVGTAFAQGPNNSGTYYRGADGQKGEALKTALYNIIKEPKVTSYAGLKDAYTKTDVRPDGSLRDWYSNITHYVPGGAFGSNNKEGAGYNREHSVPQSWFSEASPMKSDIVHVLPTDAYINNMRSSNPFGEVNPNASNYKQSANGYSKSGSARSGLGYSGVVFEPNDEIKGDIARIYFYMATCYQNVILNWTNGTGGSVIGGTTYQPFKQWVMDMMLRWSQEDPVDDVETARNNAVYTVQKNRNPFVDYPGLEDYVWGDKKTEPFSYDNYSSDPTYVSAPVFSPNGGTFTDFVEVTLSCRTEGAAIYYTTDGSTATEGATRYEGPIILTETTTLKAVAVKDNLSSQLSTATFTIKSGGDVGPGGETSDGVIALNNAFFNTNKTGSLQKEDNADLVGTKGGVTVVYSLGTGSYRYVNDSHIRVYGGNTLTFTASDGRLSTMTFELVENSTKTLQASVGQVNGLVWTGDADEVVFSVDSGSGHMKMKSVTVTLTGVDGIGTTQTIGMPAVVYDLQGRRVMCPRRGFYVKDGKKFFVR